MPWVMAGMTALQMLQGNQNQEDQKRLTAAGIRYSPWSGISQIGGAPETGADTLQQGVTGIYGQMQNQKKSDMQDKLTQAQIDRLSMLSGKSKPGGSLMNEYQAAPRGYDLNGANGADRYMQANPWATTGGRY